MNELHHNSGIFDHQNYNNKKNPEVEQENLLR